MRHIPCFEGSKLSPVILKGKKMILAKSLCLASEASNRLWWSLVFLGSPGGVTVGVRPGEKRETDLNGASRASGCRAQPRLATCLPSSRRALGPSRAGPTGARGPRECRAARRKRVTSCRGLPPEAALVRVAPLLSSLRMRFPALFISFSLRLRCFV